MKINTTYFKLKERHIYGSSRVGVRNSDLDMLPLPDKDFSMTTVHYSIGSRTYELSNPLPSVQPSAVGNVLSVISDKVIPVFPYSNVISEMLADIRVAQDYSPFGGTLDGRNFVVDEGYRYGYQGSEKDEEVKGEGNSYTTHFRLLDPRLGRWMTTDPIIHPYQLTYCSMSNNPIFRIDPTGDDDFFDKYGNYISSTAEGNAIRIITSDETFDQVQNNILEKTQLLTSFSFSEDQGANRAMLSNVATYYAMQVGINEKILVAEHVSERAAAFYKPCNGILPPCDEDFIAIVVHDGKIKDELGDKYNLMSTLVHEKNHEDDYSTHQPLNHVNAILVAAKHSSFQNTTTSFKHSQLNYSGKLLNEALEKGASLEDVRSRIEEVQKTFEDVGLIFYDDETKSVITVFMMEEVDVIANPK